MPTIVHDVYEAQLDDLLALATRVEQIFSAAGLEYRIVGGLATFFYVEEAIPDAARLTRDIDIVVRREDVERIAAAADTFGFRYRHVAGMDMLIRKEEPTARRAVHMVIAGEKVRPDYPEPVPLIGEAHRIRGVRLIPLLDLIRMKLTSNRLKDGAHIIDLDQAGLITPEIEAGLSPLLRERLAEARARG